MNAFFQLQFFKIFPCLHFAKCYQTVASSGKCSCVFPRDVAIDVCIGCTHFINGKMLMPYKKSKIFLYFTVNNNMINIKFLWYFQLELEHHFSHSLILLVFAGLFPFQDSTVWIIISFWQLLLLLQSSLNKRYSTEYNLLMCWWEIQMINDLET